MSKRRQENFHLSVPVCWISVQYKYSYRLCVHDVPLYQLAVPVLYTCILCDTLWPEVMLVQSFWWWVMCMQLLHICMHVHLLRLPHNVMHLSSWIITYEKKYNGMVRVMKEVTWTRQTQADRLMQGEGSSDWRGCRMGKFERKAEVIHMVKY